ncbi:PAS domain S-box protein [bacterium]|nr:PAS domain S-box protein [bacterium]
MDDNPPEHSLNESGNRLDKRRSELDAELKAALRAFFDNAVVGAAILDRDARFIYMNDPYCRIVGYGREELMAGMTPLDFIPDADRERVRELLLPFLRGETAKYDIEHRHVRKDGAEIWVHVTAGLIRDAAGEPTRLAAIIEDITPRKRAEEDLISVAQFARENPDPVLRIGFDGHILFANSPAEHLMRELGWRGEDHAPPGLLMLVNTAREGVDGEIEIKYGPDGTKSMDFTRVALVEKGCVNLYGRDTTERRQAEDALRRSRRDLEAVNQTLEQRIAERTAEADARTAQLRKLASELTRTEQRERRRFAQMLHDHLQQLLVGAKFNASIIERRITDTNVRRYLGYVIELLDQSIAASRSLTIELSPPVLFEGKLFPALQWLVRWMEENHGLRIELNSEDEVYPLDADMRVLLFQCVRELLFNVVKHAGVTEASITMGRIDSSLRIVVEDRGSGFDPAEMKAGSGEFSGLGLLNIQERLILHGGVLEIASAPGAGTRITITAPLILHEAAPAPAAEIPGRGAPAKPGQPIRVLIADDHAVVRDGLSQILQADPTVEVVGTAADGQQAIDLSVSLQPDVVLMDVSMPRVSGIEATRRLHRSVNIIGLSMHSEIDMAERMREAGAVDYIVKTAPPEEVITAIHNAARKTHA